MVDRLTRIVEQLEQLKETNSDRREIAALEKEITREKEAQKNVSGVVRLELYKGNCRVLGRKSDMSLYREDFATFEDDIVFSQKDAEGFIRLNALRLRIQKMLEK